MQHSNCCINSSYKKQKSTGKKLKEILPYSRKHIYNDISSTSTNLKHLKQFKRTPVLSLNNSKKQVDVLIQPFPSSTTEILKSHEFFNMPSEFQNRHITFFHFLFQYLSECKLQAA